MLANQSHLYSTAHLQHAITDLFWTQTFFFGFSPLLFGGVFRGCGVRRFWQVFPHSLAPWNFLLVIQAFFPQTMFCHVSPVDSSALPLESATEKEANSDSSRYRPGFLSMIAFQLPRPPDNAAQYIRTENGRANKKWLTPTVAFRMTNVSSH